VVTFADYGIDDPSGGPASVGEDGELEVLLVFSRPPVRRSAWLGRRGERSRRQHVEHGMTLERAVA